MYPASGNVELGQGWSGEDGRPKNATCVTFGTTPPVPYQEIRASVSRAADDETLMFSTTFKSSASVSGGLSDVLSGSADGSLNISLFHKSTAASNTYVSNIVITNGLESVSPASGPGKAMRGVFIAPGAAKILTQSTAEFEKACGRYFVSGIVKGGLLSFVYRLHDASYDDRVKLETAFRMGGSYLSITAKGSSEVTTELERLRTNKNVAVDVTISGGKSMAVPVGVEDAPAIIAGFAKSIAENPKPSFVVLTPYEDLPNWRSQFARADAGLKALYLRLAARLAFLVRTIDEIKADRFSHDVDHQESLYLTTSQNGGVRREGGQALDDVRDAVITRMNVVRQRVAELEDNRCETAQPRSRSACHAKAGETAELELDDYAYRVMLPLPANVVPAPLIAELSDPSVPIDSKRYVYSTLLYGFWVDKASADRCESLGDCRKSSDLTSYLKLARISVGEGITLSCSADDGGSTTKKLLERYVPTSFTSLSAGYKPCPVDPPKPEDAMGEQTRSPVDSGLEEIRTNNTPAGRALRDTLRTYHIED